MLALGGVGLLQLKDLNEEKVTASRMFASQVHHCEVLERSIRFLESQVGG
jgi:hypothetical protein